MAKINSGSLNLSADMNPKFCWPNRCKGNKIVIPATVASIIVAVILLIIAIWWKCNRKRRGSNSGKGESFRSSKEKKSLKSKNPEFSYSLVVSITNFRTIIGQRGFGKVYFGTLEDDTQVAVKLLSPSSKQGPKEFHNEAIILMKVYHGNLVSLIGYCNDGKNILLIYQCVPTEIYNNIYQRRVQKFWIGVGDAAQGMEYLHNGCKPPIIHRDVKTSNILLDENWNAKIADFGLSRDSVITHTTEVAGTIAYMDPEYLSSRKMDMKNDVYSFGVVLLELITGKSAVIKGPDNIHIIHWTKPLMELGDIYSIVDSRLNGEFNPKAAWKAVEIAMSCVSPSSRQRPDMSQVVAELKECLAIEMVGPDETSRGTAHAIMSTPTIDTDSLLVSVPLVYAR